MSVGLFVEAESLRGATEGLRAGDGAEDWSSVLLAGSFGGFGLWAVSVEGFRSEAASVALGAGVDALRGAVEGLRAVEVAGDSAGLVAAVEALLGARDGLRSGAALLGLAVEVDALGGA